MAARINAKSVKSAGAVNPRVTGSLVAMPREDWNPSLDGSPSFDVVGDFGAGTTKVWCSGQTVEYPSVVGVVDTSGESFDASDSGEVPDRIAFTWNGRVWTVGRQVLETGTMTQHRRDQSNLGGDVHVVTMLAALCELIPYPRAHVRLVTQIPINFSKDIGKVTAMAGTYDLVVKGERRRYWVQVDKSDIHPESQGILFAHALGKKGVTVKSCASLFWDRRTLVVDAGTHTINLGVYRRGGLVLGKTIANTGWITVFDHCAHALFLETGRRPDVDRIDFALRYNDGWINWMGDDFNLNETPFAPVGWTLVGDMTRTFIQNNFEGGAGFERLLGGGGLWPKIERIGPENFPKHFLGAEHFAETTGGIKPWSLNMEGLVRRMLRDKSAMARSGGDGEGLNA